MMDSPLRMNRVPLGVLDLYFHKSRVLINTEPIGGEMNPQIYIEMEGEKKLTKNKYGREPLWEEGFSFEIYSFTETLKISCRDVDSIMNDFLGSTILDLKTIAINKPHK